MGTGLARYVAKRLGFAVLMLVGVSLILFTIMRLAPGGPEAVLIGGEFSQETAAQVRHRLGLFLILVVVALFEASLLNTALVIGLVTWTHVARVVRGECPVLRAREFVDAARALGASHRRILARHLLVNALPVIIVQATLLLGQTILIESGLSYLGLGAQPPLLSWANMVVEGRQFLASAWWIATFPGLAIFVTVLGFDLFGDGLRDALDPALRSDA